MTDTPEIARIRAALAACCRAECIREEQGAKSDLKGACNPVAMTALLAHIDAQAAEIGKAMK